MQDSSQILLVRYRKVLMFCFSQGFTAVSKTSTSDPCCSELQNCYSIQKFLIIAYPPHTLPEPCRQMSASFLSYSVVHVEYTIILHLRAILPPDLFNQQVASTDLQTHHAMLELLKVCASKLLIETFISLTLVHSSARSINK